MMGVLVELFGITLNRAVFYLNGGMPIPVTHSFPETPYGHHIPITEQTRLLFLADVIRCPWGYISLGDTLIILGAVASSVLLLIWAGKRIKVWIRSKAD